MPLSLVDTTAAYDTPPISKVSALCGAASSSKPPGPSVAEPAASSVPLAWMRTSWTAPGLGLTPPPSPPAATTAYVTFPIERVATPIAPSSVVKEPVPLAAEPLPASVPSASMRISCMPSPFQEAATAYCLPSILNASMSYTSCTRSKPAVLLAAESAADRVPLACIRISCMPSSS